MATDTVINDLNAGVGSLRQVLDAAAPGDTIVFASTLSGDVIELQSSLVISNSVTIDGTVGTSRIALSGSALVTPLVVQGGTVTVQNTELELGNGTGADATATTAATGGAGAILLSGGQLTLNDTLLFGNTAVGGMGAPETSAGPGGSGADAGTVLVTGGSLIVQDSTLERNTATGGMGGGSPTYDSEFASPTPGATGGSAAGGIFVEAGSVTVTDTTIEDNGAVGGTGGRGGSAYASSGAGGAGAAGGGVGGNAAGVFYNRGGSLFVGSNSYASNTGVSGDGGMGGYGGAGQFARNGSSYSNGGGSGGFGGSASSPGGAGYSGGAGHAYYPYTGLTVGEGGTGGAQGAVGGFGGSGSNAGGGGGGGGGGTGLGSNTSLGVPAQPVACFAAGTRLLTPSGEVAVEHLRVGDRVVSAFGGSVPVVWFGHRRMDCRRHPTPHDVQPVRVCAHAFSAGQPQRDVLLSPDHAVFIDGALIPIRYLVNGSSIARQQVDEVTYCHVELPAHGVILAEGLPCESYLDTGNRSAFANGGLAVQMHPNFALGIWQARACAPLVWDGAELEAARSYLLERAELLGFAATNEPALRLLAGGHVVHPEIAGRLHRFRLPATACGIRLISRSAIPAEVSADNRDHRRLGVGVARITLDGHPISLTDARLGSGWHNVEHDGTNPAWRWTDGDAGLALAGVRVLAVEIAMTARYWLDRESGQERAA